MNLEIAQLILTQVYEKLDTDAYEFGKDATPFPSTAFEIYLAQSLKSFNKTSDHHFIITDVLQAVIEHTKFKTLEEHARAYYDVNIAPKNAFIFEATESLRTFGNHNMTKMECVEELEIALAEYNKQSKKI